MTFHFVLNIAIFGCFFAMLTGLYMLAFKTGRRKRGLQIFAAAFISGLICIILSANEQAKADGWTNSDEQQAASKQGITSPEVWQKMQAEAELAQQAQDAAETEARRKKGFNCLSPLDGHQIALILAVKQQLRDPASFEPIETKVGPMDTTGKHAITMSYRAQNGFGGMNVATAVAIMTNEGCAIELLGVE